MDEKMAWDVFNAGQPVNVKIAGQLFEGVMVTGLQLPGGMELLLRTRIGEPDRRIRVAIERVELVPST